VFKKGMMCTMMSELRGVVVECVGGGCLCYQRHSVKLDKRIHGRDRSVGSLKGAMPEDRGVRIARDIPPERGHDDTAASHFQMLNKFQGSVKPKFTTLPISSLFVPSGTDLGDIQAKLVIRRSDVMVHRHRGETR
ncbi:hypothetical protein KI387_010978, partial [Taxus chinensis]